VEYWYPTFRESRFSGTRVRSFRLGQLASKNKLLPTSGLRITLVMAEGLVIAFAATILLTFYAFRNEIREWRREVREKDQEFVAALADISGPYDETIPSLAQLPPPRAVRMSFRGKGSAFLIPGVFLMLLALTAKDYSHPTASWQRESAVFFFRVLFGLAVLSGLLQWRIFVRHRRLVSNGEAAIGRITRNYGKSRYGQGVRYQFNTQTGETFSKRATSWEVRLFKEGMRIPVFYDPAHPKKQVALLAAYYEPDLRKRAEARSSPDGAKS